MTSLGDNILRASQMLGSDKKVTFSPAFRKLCTAMISDENEVNNRPAKQ